MYFNLHNGKLNVYGVGIVKYNGKDMFVLPYRMVDTCIKNISCDSKDICVTTTEDVNNSLVVDCGTGYVMFYIFTSYCIEKIRLLILDKYY